MKTAVLFDRIGPYHEARLRALASRCEVVAIQMSSVDETYAWDPIAHHSQYAVRTLFTDRDIARQPSARVHRRVHDVLDALRPTVVGIPGWWSPAALAALSWCRAHGATSILMSESTRHDAPRNLPTEWIKRAVVRQFDAALVGGAPQREYARLLGMAEGSVFEGYDVVDNDYFAQGAARVRARSDTERRRLSLPSSYFFAASRFIEKKNLFRLIQAYADHVRDARARRFDPWKLVIAGDGEQREALMQHVARCGIDGDVFFPGFIQYGDLPAYYSLAGAFVHASTHEQWGLVVNEAMASGLPVLVSRTCGCARDLVREGENGFTFDPRDPDDLARKMTAITHGDLSNMGAASTQLISRFSPDAFATGFMAAAKAKKLSRASNWLGSIFLRALQHR